MPYLKLTKKLQKRLGSKFISNSFRPASNTVSILGDWIATFVTANRKPYLLFLNEKTLINVLIDYSPKETMIERFLNEMRNILAELNVNTSAIEKELKAYDDIGLLENKNKVNTGYLVESAKAALFYIYDYLYEKGYFDLKEVQDKLNYNPHVKTEFCWSEEYIQTLFNVDPKLRKF